MSMTWPKRNIIKSQTNKKPNDMNTVNPQKVWTILAKSVNIILQIDWTKGKWKPKRAQ